MTDNKLPLIYKKVEDCNRTYEVRDAEGNLFMWDEWHENIAPNAKMAAYIVSTTNGHDKLIAALKKIAARKNIKMSELEGQPYNWEIAEEALKAALEGSTHG